jgi:hypothetical protein
MVSPHDPIPGPPGPAPIGRLSWPARGGLIALALVALTWVALHAAVDRPAFRERIQARGQELLRARLGPVELDPAVEIDWAFRVWFGPMRLPAVTPGAEPLLQVERIRVRASVLAALSGRIEAASVRAYGVRFAPGEHGHELEAALDRWRARRLPAGPPGPPRRSRDPVVYLRGLTVAVPWEGATQLVGPIDARLERRSGLDGERIEIVTWLPGGGEVEAHLRRASATAPGWAFEVMATLSATDLPPAAQTLGIAVESGELSLELKGATTSTGARATVNGALARLRLGGERLGPDPIGPLSASGQAELTWIRSTRRLELQHGQLQPLGPLHVDLEGALALGSQPSFMLSVLVPPVEYRALVAALPPPLAPPLAAPRPPGSFGGSLKLTGPVTPMTGWTVSAALDLGLMHRAASAEPSSPLLLPFVARPDGDDGVAVRLGPTSPTFVPLAELPDHVVRAVTTAEDAGFFGHQGFDFAEILDAVSTGAQTGRAMRGGSTITQQLAKNLYLSRDRTLARKTREALVTIALEASLPKTRLLELYLNLIEWAPGLHGIGAASRHYFGVDARQLTPRQACFLAAIIPSPNRSHRLVAAGLADRAYRSRVDDLLLRLNSFEVISDESLHGSLEEPLRFAFGAPAPRPDQVPGLLSGDGD